MLGQLATRIWSTIFTLVSMFQNLFAHFNDFGIFAQPRSASSKFVAHPNVTSPRLRHNIH